MPEPIQIQVDSRVAEIYRSLNPDRRRMCDYVINRWIEHEADRVEECARRVASPLFPEEPWRVAVPIDLAAPNGPCVHGSTSFDSWISDENDLYGLDSWIELSREDEDRVPWLRDAEMLLAKADRKQKSLKVVGVATSAEARKYRIPVWIQDPEIPVCCSLKMHFVGQIDDDNICTQAPPGALLWWHDIAAFYVFTCSVCLNVKAVGQQY